MLGARLCARALQYREEEKTARCSGKGPEEACCSIPGIPGVWLHVHLAVQVSDYMCTLQSRCLTTCAPCSLGVWLHVHLAVQVSDYICTLQCRCLITCAPCSLGVWLHVHLAVQVSDYMCTLQSRCLTTSAPCSPAVWLHVHLAVQASVILNTAPRNPCVGIHLRMATQASEYFTKQPRCLSTPALGNPGISAWHQPTQVSEYVCMHVSYLHIAAQTSGYTCTKYTGNCHSCLSLHSNRRQCKSPT